MAVQRRFGGREVRPQLDAEDDLCALDGIARIDRDRCERGGVKNARPVDRGRSLLRDHRSVRPPAGPDHLRARSQRRDRLTDQALDDRRGRLLLLDEIIGVDFDP